MMINSKICASSRQWISWRTRNACTPDCSAANSTSIDTVSSSGMNMLNSGSAITFAAKPISPAIVIAKSITAPYSTSVTILPSLPFFLLS